MNAITTRFRGMATARADATDPAALVVQIQKAFAEFKAENDKQIADLKKGQADVVQAEKVDRINAVITDLQKQLGDLAVKAAAFEMSPDKKTDPALAAHRKAFESWFRKGIEADLRSLEVKAATVLQTQSDPDGGFLCPEEMEAAIDRVLGTMSAMRTVATVRQIGAATYKKLVSQGGSTSGWVGETGSRAATSTPTLSQLEFPIGEIYAMPGATQTMLDDGRVNIEEWLASEVALEFAEEEGDAFIDGNGVNKPRGLLSYSNVANASYAWGSIGYIVTGHASSFAATNPADKLIDVIHALKRGYRMNAAWMMNDLTVAAIRKFKDGQGQYLWQPGLQAGAPPMILGYPAVSDDNMPDLGSGAYAAAFGDFRRAYLILDRVGVRVLRDPFTSKPNVLFYTTKRVGGGVQNFEAVKLLKCST